MQGRVQWLAIAGNVALQSVGSLISHLIATWFGPVSIVVPFFYSATLLSNMLIFGLLGEKFTKNMRVGTHVIVVAAILLPLVGPNIQEDQDIGILLHHWYAILWFMILLIACAVTGTLLAFDINKYNMNARTTILLIARAASISVNLTVSRAFILGPSQVVLVSFIVIKILSGAIYTYAIVVQSFAVEQARFVPLNATTIIIVNALTGVIIWEDWRVVESWYGYICVFVLLGLGCDLLLSVPLLNAENPEFGANQRASLIINRTRSLKNLTIDTADYDDVPDVDGNNEATTTTTTSPEDKEAVPPYHEHRHLTRKQAWKEIVSPIHNNTTSNMTSSSTNEMHFARNDDWKRGVSPRAIGGTVRETTALIAEQPKNLGKKIVKTAQQIGDKGRQLVDNITIVSDKGIGQPLSRLAAWKDTISPLKSNRRTEKTDDNDEGDDDGGT
jgi:hypothetical protein